MVRHGIKKRQRAIKAKQKKDRIPVLSFQYKSPVWHTFVGPNEGDVIFEMVLPESCQMSQFTYAVKGRKDKPEVTVRLEGNDSVGNVKHELKQDVVKIDDIYLANRGETFTVTLSRGSVDLIRLSFLITIPGNAFVIKKDAITELNEAVKEAEGVS